MYVYTHDPSGSVSFGDDTSLCHSFGHRVMPALPPRGADVAWHIPAPPPYDARFLSTRASMFPTTKVDRDGILISKYEQPLMFQLAFVLSGSKWHGFHIKDIGTSRADFNSKHKTNLTPADIETLKDNARRARDANGDMVRQIVDRKRPLDEVHARFYIHYIEPGLGAPSNAAPYEMMLHEAANEDKQTKKEKQMAPDGEYGTRVMQALKPGVFGLLASLRNYTETIIGILMCTLILILSELAVHMDTGTWQNVLTGGVAVSLVSNAIGCMFTTMLGIGVSDLGRWSGASLGAWAREWLERWCPWYSWAIRSVGTTQDILRCMIRVLLPWAIPAAMALIALPMAVTTAVGTAVAATGAGTVAAAGGVMLYDALSTAIQQAIDEVAGIKYMSPEWQKRCSNIEMLRRILSSIGGLFERERQKSAAELKAETDVAKEEARQKDLEEQLAAKAKAKAEEEAAAKLKADEAAAKVKAEEAAAKLERERIEDETKKLGAQFQGAYDKSKAAEAEAAAAAKLERDRIEDETKKLAAQFQGAYDKSKAAEEQAERDAYTARHDAADAAEKKRLDDERTLQEDETKRKLLEKKRLEEEQEKKRQEDAAAVAQILADEAAKKVKADQAAQKLADAAKRTRDTKAEVEERVRREQESVKTFIKEQGDRAAANKMSVTTYCNDSNVCRDVFMEKGWSGEWIKAWGADYHGDEATWKKATESGQRLKESPGPVRPKRDGVSLAWRSGLTGTKDDFVAQGAGLDHNARARLEYAVRHAPQSSSDLMTKTKDPRVALSFGETTTAASGIFDAAIGLVKTILALDQTKELDFSFATLQTNLMRNLGTASGMVHTYTTLSTVLAKLGVKVPAHSSLPSYVVSWTGLCMLAAMQVAFATGRGERDGRSLASFFRTLATVGMHHFAPSATKLLQCKIAVDVVVSDELSKLLEGEKWLGPTVAKTLSALVRSGVLDAKPTEDSALGVLRDPVMVSAMLRMDKLTGSPGVDTKLVRLRDFCQSNEVLKAVISAARTNAETNEKSGDALAYMLSTLRPSLFTDAAAAPSDAQKRALESVKAHAALEYLRNRKEKNEKEIPSTAAGWVGLAFDHGLADLKIQLDDKDGKITEKNWMEFAQDATATAQKAAMRAAGDFSKALKGKATVHSERVFEPNTTTLTPEFKGRLTELLVKRLGSKVDLSEFLDALGAHIHDPTSKESKDAFLASLGRVATSKIDIDNVTAALATLHDAYKYERSVSIFSQKVIETSIAELSAAKKREEAATKASGSADTAARTASEAAAIAEAAARTASAAADAATRASNTAAGEVRTAKASADAASLLLQQKEKATQGREFARDELLKQESSDNADVRKAAEIMKELGLNPTKKAETARTIHKGLNSTDGFATDSGVHTGDTFTNSASESRNVGHVVRVADDGTITVEERVPGNFYGAKYTEVKLSDSVKGALAQALTGRRFDSAFVKDAAATHTRDAREAATRDESAYHAAVTKAQTTAEAAIRERNASAQAKARLAEAKRSENETKASLIQANDAQRALERQRAVRASVDAFDKELESDLKDPSLPRDPFVARAARYAAQYARDTVSGAMNLVRTGATAEAFAQKMYLQQQAQKHPRAEGLAALAQESAAEFNREGGARYAAIDDINRRAAQVQVRVPHWSRVAPEVIGSRAAVDLSESAKAIRPLALDVRAANEVPADAIYTNVKRALVVGPWSGRHAKPGGIWAPSAYKKMQVAVISAESQEPAFLGGLVAALRERGTPPPYDAVVVTAPEVAHSLELGRMMRELLLEGGVALVAYEAHCAPKPVDGGLLYAGSFSVGESGDVYCAMSRVVGVWGDKKLCRQSSTRNERDVQLLTCARRFVAAASIELAVDKLVLGV